MNGKLLATVLIGIGIGLAFPFFGHHQDAIAQQQEKAAAKWEYQVVHFRYGDLEGDTKKMNSLAAENWEYVGLLATTGGGAAAGGGGTVAFKRLKT
jgi:hypothetical protein